MRQARQTVEGVDFAGEAILSPQRAQAGPLWAENSDQQTGQIGTEESCGKDWPQRSHEAGSRAQLKLSIGLRSTRTTARQRVVCARGTSAMRMAVSLEKTHLASGQKPNRCSPMGKYSAELSWSSTEDGAGWRDASKGPEKTRTGSEPECTALQKSAARVYWGFSMYDYFDRRATDRCH
jgi:hypothetical protein